MPELVFPNLDSIVHLADLYREHDTIAQMQFRNGIPPELFINSWILNQFANENNLRMGTPHAKIRAAYSCAKFYGRTPEQLIEAFVRVHSLEFYDVAVKAEMRAVEDELRADPG